MTYCLTCQSVCSLIISRSRQSEQKILRSERSGPEKEKTSDRPDGPRSRRSAVQAVLTVRGLDGPDGPRSWRSVDGPVLKKSRTIRTVLDGPVPDRPTRASPKNYTNFLAKLLNSSFCEIVLPSSLSIKKILTIDVERACDLGDMSNLCMETVICILCR